MNFKFACNLHDLVLPILCHSPVTRINKTYVYEEGNTCRGLIYIFASVKCVAQIYNTDIILSKIFALKEQKCLV